MKKKIAQNPESIFLSHSIENIFHIKESDWKSTTCLYRKKRTYIKDLFLLYFFALFFLSHIQRFPVRKIFPPPPLKFLKFFPVFFAVTRAFYNQGNTIRIFSLFFTPISLFPLLFIQQQSHTKLCFSGATNQDLMNEWVG